MATKKTTDAKSVSNNTKTTGLVNQSVAVVREQNKIDQERQKTNYAAAKEALKQLKDINSNTVSNISAYNRETLRSIVQSPASNETRLREAARYLYYRSQIFFRLINWYADMWCLSCRKVIPRYDLTKDNDSKKMLKSLNETLDALDRYNLTENIIEVLIHCYLEDICYAIFFREETSSFFYILDPSECKIIGRYDTGDLAYAIDASKWARGKKLELAEIIGSPLTDIIKEYERTGEKWIPMPDEFAACFKFRIEDLDHVIVPFISLLQSLSSLTDSEDVQAILDDQAIYRLIAVPMPTLSGAKTADEFSISPDLLIQYFNKLSDALPDYVSAAPIPGELTNDNVIDFSTSAADKDVQRLQQNQDTLLSTSGGGAVINSNKITSTAAFNAWLKSESLFAISTLIGQIQGFTNRMLSYDCSNPCRLEYFKVTEYTKDEMYEKLLKQCQYSFSDRLALNTFCGISEKATMALEYLETQVLKLPELMIHPLNSSFTQSGSNGEVGQGRDTLPDDEIEPSTERSRNS